MNTKGFGKQQPKRSTKMDDHLPPNTTQQDLLNYIQENWDTIAAFAYDGYLSEGKGIVVADWDLSLTKVLPFLPEKTFESLNSDASKQLDHRMMFPLWYLSQKSELFSEMGKVMFSGTAWSKMIDRYDPETMLIVAFGWGAMPFDAKPWRTPNWMVRTITIANAVSPREAFEQSRGRLDEFLVKEDSRES